VNVSSGAGGEPSSGYACAIVCFLRQLREGPLFPQPKQAPKLVFAAADNSSNNRASTDDNTPNAPVSATRILSVGIFGLAPGGSEGHSEKMADFRLAQTAGGAGVGAGVSGGAGRQVYLPNSLIPRSYFVPTHDLGDPCDKHQKSKPQCVGNGTWSYLKLTPYDKPVTPFRDSRIHPRDKLLVGTRAAHAYWNSRFDGVGHARRATRGRDSIVDSIGRGPISGPVFEGCKLSTNETYNKDGEVTGTTLAMSIRFDSTLLQGAQLQLRPPPAPPNSTLAETNSGAVSGVEMRVCTVHNDSIRTEAFAAGMKPVGMTPAGMTPPSCEWVMVPLASMTLSSSEDATVVINLTSMAQSAIASDMNITAMRYAWSEEPCCAKEHECNPVSCPLWAVGPTSPFGVFPALPFIVNISACLSPV
jgi:hypothetical protein